MKFRVSVDLNLVDTAEEELFQILLYQYSSKISGLMASVQNIQEKVFPILRIVALIASGLGILLSLLISWRGYFVFFIIAFALFYFLIPISRKLDRYIDKFHRFAGRKVCRFAAKRAFSKAREFLPYQAEYEFLGATLQCYREKAENTELYWSKALNGVAICGDSVAVFFEKWRSVSPTIVVLYSDCFQLEPALRAYSFPFKLKQDLLP
ncbi:MAG: hypothetical protein AAGG02_19260 [Cyanobacteria bacterium P01_H01_bin.15]